MDIYSYVPAMLHIGIGDLPISMKWFQSIKWVDIKFSKSI